MKGPARKNIEVEIRALISDISNFKKKLKELGAVYKNKSYLQDTYFCRKDLNKLNQVEMHKVGSYSLRIRKSRRQKEKLKSTLNSKTIIKKGDHNSWIEHEIEIADPRETAKILVQTEFKPFFQLEKYRFFYTLNGLNIFVEDIKDFGQCVEVEIMAESGKQDEAKKKIMVFLNKVKVDKDNIVKKSVTNLIMKKRAFKSSIQL